MSTEASPYNPYKNRSLPVGTLHYPLEGNPEIYTKAMLEYGEPELIYSTAFHADHTGELALLNLGDAQGGSAILMAEGLRDSRRQGHIWTVDCYSDKDLRRSRDNARSRGVQDFISYYQGKTEDVAVALRRGEFEFDFIFIDADHSYEGVKSDWENYHGLLRHGGYIAFHDTNQEGPDQVIRELVEPDWHLVEWVNRIKVFKRKDNV